MEHDNQSDEESSQIIDKALVHIFECTAPRLCSVPFCRAMKRHWLHYLGYQRKVNIGCVLCKQMQFNVRHHIRTCKEPCKVPPCVAQKAEKIRQMERQRDAPMIMLNNMALIASQSLCRPKHIPKKF